MLSLPQRRLQSFAGRGGHTPSFRSNKTRHVLCQIREDADRPIISGVTLDSNGHVSLLGFNIAVQDLNIVFEYVTHLAPLVNGFLSRWHDKRGTHTFSESALSINADYGAHLSLLVRSLFSWVKGKTHRRSYLLQEASADLPIQLRSFNGLIKVPHYASLSHFLSNQVYAEHNNKRSYHPFYVDI